MPLATAPNLIEQTDFSGGWEPDSEPSAVPPNGLLDAINVMPDLSTGAIQTREGSVRIPNFATTGYRVASTHAYNRTTLAGVEEHRLIIVVTSDTAAVQNNLQVWEYNLDTEVATQISPATKTWVDITGLHFGFVANGTFFGGSEGDPMYSWNPDDLWVDDASSRSFPTFRDDQAYREGQEVTFNDGSTDREFSFIRDEPHADGILYPKWKTGREYSRGDRVSSRKEWGGAGTGFYWRSFKCVKKHTSGAGNEPVDTAFWRGIYPADPVNEDGDVSPQWNEIPDAPVTNVAVFHQGRVFVRDELRGREYVHYSAQANANMDDGTLEWDPKDWRVRPVVGGGFLPFQTEDGDPIVTLLSYNFYLLVFKQRSTHVIAGTSPDRWYVRNLAPVGCAALRSVCEHEGRVYFLSDQGLYSTDGTSVDRAPGADKIQEWIRQALDWEGAIENITMWSAGGFVKIALPTGDSKVADRVIVYHPDSGSFWPQSMQVSAVAVARKDGTDKEFFGIPTKTGTYELSTYAWTDTQYHSSSTRTTVAVVETNLFKNPSFHARSTQNEKVYWADDWSDTTPDKVSKVVTAAAARNRSRGCELRNLRTHDFGPDEGIYQEFADEDATTHTISFYVRRPDWKTATKPIGYIDAKLFVWQDDGDSPVPIVEGNHTYTKVGRGWFRVSATYQGSATPKWHGILVRADHMYHVDQALCLKGVLVPWFDGEGGDGVEGVVIGGGDGLVMQYGGINTDDLGNPALTAVPIEWSLRTAWFSFGALREDRRIRRTWALVRGDDLTVSLSATRNYQPSNEYTKTMTAPVNVPATHFEGQMMADSFAVSLEVGGEGGPAALLGVAIDTQPRRTRYHS